MNNLYAIIVAGGKGSRMQTELPKQFVPVAGKPMLMHSIQAFYDYDRHINIIVVLPEVYFGLWEELCRNFSFPIQHQLAQGGEQRYYSVKNGLELIPETQNAIVAIHDGARPLINRSLIHRVFSQAKESGAAIPVIRVKESVRIMQNEKSIPFDRNKFLLVQTPQCFEISILKEAYQQPYNESITDDAMLVEAAGHSISMVEGHPDNIKVTFQGDLKIADILLRKIS